jgi:tetratricopeptide (TPR) repeat protein
LHADRIAFAKQALAIDADRCADAHILLAEEEAPALDQAITYYQQATKAGLRAVLECNRDILTTPPTPDDDRWEYLPLRPYLRALAGLGCTLFKQGSMEKCCEWLERYLRLDRDDTLLCRPVWLAAKFYLRDWQAIDGFLDDWRPTGADSATANASMFYIYSLVRHQLHGQLGRNDEKLDEITELAFECNIHIAMLLLGKSRISFTQIPLPNTIHVRVENIG